MLLGRSVSSSQALLLALLATACGRRSSSGDEPDRSDAVAPVARRAAIAPEPRDYEKPVEELYKYLNDYRRRWPVEYHIRVVEGLTQDLEHAAYDLERAMGAPYFADQTELGWARPGPERPLVGAATVSSWSVEEPRASTAAEVGQHLATLLSGFQFLDIAEIKVKRGEVTPDGSFDTVTAIELAGRERGRGWRRDTGMASVRFAKVAGFWRITRFALTSLTTQRAPDKMFADVSDQWLAGLPPSVVTALRTRTVADDIERANNSRRTSASDVGMLDETAQNAHPGVAVVDINRDELDDLLVWDMAGDSVLLENAAGRGFVDRTDAYGLRFRDVSSAAFADLDNDGQLDVVIGRWGSPSGIYLSRGGRFFPSDANRLAPLPASVTSVALADVDGDGLLDIYFATAANDLFHSHLEYLLGRSGRRSARDPAADGLDPNEIAALERALPAARAAKAAGRFDPAIHQFGPANVMMVNRGGGRFVDRTRELGLELYRNSLQATFADLDGDETPDLYVGNDFGPANLYLSRGGRYVDVSGASGADQIFYGMGACSGDVDNDGDIDVLATAMYSSAGTRITADPSSFTDSLDEAARQERRNAARGNTLLRNDGAGRFSDATAEPPFASLRKVSWAYSSQLFDADGDGYLDVHAPNGYFTSVMSAGAPYVRDG